MDSRDSFSKAAFKTRVGRKMWVKGAWELAILKLPKSLLSDPLLK